MAEHPWPWRWDKYNFLLDAAGAEVLGAPGEGGCGVEAASPYAREVVRAAPEMEELLRGIEFKIIGQRSDTMARTCYFCFRTEREGHLLDCGLGELFARIDAAKAGG